MKKTTLKITENTPLISGVVYKMVLSGDVGINLAGQFINIQLPNFTLRRPFGVADCSKDSITILYRILGNGTRYMSTIKPNTTSVDVLTGLGNGFDLTTTDRPLIIAGGMGAAPMHLVAKEFKNKGIEPETILGFRTKTDAFYVQEFQKIGKTTVCTDDGSLGFKGNVVDYLKGSSQNNLYFACGPEPMLKGLVNFSKNGYISTEERMACGFGACMGCTIKTKECYKRVCKEGPVIHASEVIFDE